MSLFNELKRRNVIRVAIAYLVIAWVIVQVIGVLSPMFDVSASFQRGVVLVLAVGFIPAMFFAWAFEITPEGIKKEKNVERDESITNLTAKKLDMVTIGLLVVAIGLFGLDRFSPRDAQTQDSALDIQSDSNTSQVEPSISEVVATSKEKSIAVLPFADMSQEGDQEYFADGISEEILNVLVRIPKLKVAGRTSSFSFKGKNEDLRIIGESLGVNHILEGSVRRSNTKLRITAQLIRSDDGFHLWSETYDREIADIFDIQDEIAKAVADQMVISLGLEVKTKDQNRTADLVVYEDYLKAKQLYLKRGGENLKQALELLNEAISRDPNYAPAWTLKAYIYGVYSSYVSGEEKQANTKKWEALGKTAAERAISLNPESGEAYAALGNFLLNNFEFIPGYENFERALEMEPDNSNVLDTIAQNYLAIGYFEKSKQLAERAISIDPLVAMYRNTLGRAHNYLNENTVAINNYEKSIELDPKLPFAYNNLQMHYFNAKDFSKYQSLTKLRIANGLTEGHYNQLMRVTDSEDLAKTKSALQGMRDESRNGRVKYTISIYLNDQEGLTKVLDKYSWSAEPRASLDLFGTPTAPMYNNKRWKEQVRKDGVLALWQAKGFPSQCKAVGEDDFECD